jgi:7-cyano-7-deazaguanine synthase
MTSRGKKAVVLVSGGLDSATVLAIAKTEGYRIYAMTFRYGQRHQLEAESARRLVNAYKGEKHVLVDINLRTFGGSALTSDMEVPKGRSGKEIADGSVPMTYVPARNTIFLSYALAYAEVEKISEIFIGVNYVDYSGYPDCRPEFIRAFEETANLATKASVQGDLRYRIVTPLMEMSKADIIRKGTELGVDYSLTLSCYDPSPEGKACGRCDSCILRRNGFSEAGIVDPTRYVE